MKLQCVTPDCVWETQDLAKELAKWSLIKHMQHVHPAPAMEQQVGGVGIMKPEKFPRIIIDLDSTLESWNLAEELAKWSLIKVLLTQNPPKIRKMAIISVILAI